MPPIPAHICHLPGLYAHSAETFGDRPALARREAKARYRPIAYRDLWELGLCLGTALIERGFQFQDRAAVFSEHRIEWVITNMGVLAAGGILVPRGRETSVDEMSFILNHSGSTFLFVESEPIWKRVEEGWDKLAAPTVVCNLSIAAKPPWKDGSLTFANLLAEGKALRAGGDRRIEDRMAQLTGRDCFTLIYTSGTTGKPKGAQLTHGNMLSQVRLLPIDISTEERVLSILPIWHVYERVFLDVALSRGCCTYFSSVRTLSDDIEAVQPTFMASAPRLWEMLYSRMRQRIAEAHPVRRFFFSLAYRSSRQIRRSWDFLFGRDLALKPRRWERRLPLMVLHALNVVLWSPLYIALNAGVLEKLRVALGGSFRGTVSGGGPLPPHVDAFFNFIGVPVLEGYGLTETAPVLAVRLFDKRVLGTVGPLWPETELRIIDSEGKVLYPDSHDKHGGRGQIGEIVVRGPQVMAGYYNDPEATAAVMKDGWFRTGDLGQMTFNDCLRIEGRIKETIVLLNGENVQPAPIEQAILQTDLIDQVMVVGHARKHLGALVQVNLEALRTAGLEHNDPRQAASDPKVHQLIQKSIREAVSEDRGFKSFEKIHAIGYFPRPLEIGQELTPTLKIKRHIVEQTFAPEIDALF